MPLWRKTSVCSEMERISTNKLGTSGEHSRPFSYYKVLPRSSMCKKYRTSCKFDRWPSLFWHSCNRSVFSLFPSASVFQPWSNGWAYFAFRPDSNTYASTTLFVFKHPYPKPPLVAPYGHSSRHRPFQSIWPNKQTTYLLPWFFDFEQQPASTGVLQGHHFGHCPRWSPSYASWCSSCP